MRMIYWLYNMENTDPAPITSQPLDNVSSPQPASQQTIGASDASPFQQSANSEALKQNKSLQVVTNGNPVKTSNKSGGSQTGVMVFVVVSSLLLVVVAALVFRWMMKQPEKSETPQKPVNKPKDDVKPVVSVESDAKKAVVTPPKPAKNKKKQSRSKRNKK